MPFKWSSSVSAIHPFSPTHRMSHESGGESPIGWNLIGMNPNGGTRVTVTLIGCDWIIIILRQREIPMWLTLCPFFCLLLLHCCWTTTSGDWHSEKRLSSNWQVKITGGWDWNGMEESLFRIPPTKWPSIEETHELKVPCASGGRKTPLIKSRGHSVGQSNWLSLSLFDNNSTMRRWLLWFILFIRLSLETASGDNSVVQHQRLLLLFSHPPACHHVLWVRRGKCA